MHYVQSIDIGLALKASGLEPTEENIAKMLELEAKATDWSAVARFILPNEEEK